MRFKKSTRSAANSDCVEVGSTLRHLRDSKNPHGPVLTADIAALVRHVR
ncbi:DUF397 domain-containing protein [Actinokineospora cianjurensis]|uniref:Uncharacterized protein DUF397 n=1 Tax=Actinokineospora cianjurensis TaxID=585224 RepID=A0A421BBJ6_9PSEU|nr:DUF397 domain-containing protein [Actinokineospora cianjurensis]RLK61710.1 uncharacterized protein DUF397 [Actinokineospora cianjurensis]